MGVVELLQKIQPAWIDRISHRLARGAGVRENFLEQLTRFFDLLLEAVESGDPAWLDPLIDEWTRAQTQTDLHEERSGLTPFLTQIILITYEICLETLEPAEALGVLGALLPMFTYAYEGSSKIETELRIDQIAEELQTAQQKLERLDRSKSTFISVAAHELKTPLTLIEGYASMLRDLYAGDDRYSKPILMLKGIDNGTQRLRAIVNDMIDVSLIDNNLLALNFQPVFLNQLFGILQKEFEGTIVNRNQTLTICPFPGYDQMIYGDPERLYQALRNVLLNAIKYTPDGGKLTIDGRKLPGFLEVTIADTGIGIDPRDHTRVFEKFSQVADAHLHSSGKTKFKGGGPGLGLPITRGIIEAHGGTIWVESAGYDEQNTPGSTFHILLPIRDKPPENASGWLYEKLPEPIDQSLAPSSEQ